MANRRDESWVWVLAPSLCSYKVSKTQFPLPQPSDCSLWMSSGSHHLHPTLTPPHHTTAIGKLWKIASDHVTFWLDPPVGSMALRRNPPSLLHLPKTKVSCDAAPPCQFSIYLDFIHFLEPTDDFLPQGLLCGTPSHQLPDSPLVDTEDLPSDVTSGPLVTLSEVVFITHSHHLCRPACLPGTRLTVCHDFAQELLFWLGLLLGAEP